MIDLASDAETVIVGAVGKDQLGNDLRTGDMDGDGICRSGDRRTLGL